MVIEAESGADNGSGGRIGVVLSVDPDEEGCNAVTAEDAVLSVGASGDRVSGARSQPVAASHVPGH